MAGTGRFRRGPMIRVIRDEWTPALQKAMNGLEPPKRRGFFGDLGEKILFSIRRHMDLQLGWGNKKPYERLKIRWRYHGRKDLLDVPRNRARINWGLSGEKARAESADAGQLSVVDKTKVAESSVPLQDLRDLYRAWDVTDHDANSVTVRPGTARESEKAIFNDDRGDWSWRTDNSEDVFSRFMKYIDDEVLGL